MRTPEVVSIIVVEHDGKKMFLERDKKPTQFDSVKVRLGLVAEVPEGMVSHELYIGKFGSWMAYNPPSEHLEREVDTPCLLFRKGEYFDSGILSYFGSQSDGYHLLEGFRRVGPMKTVGPRVYMVADWFEVGDIIVFVRMPHGKEVKKALGN